MVIQFPNFKWFVFLYIKGESTRQHFSQSQVTSSHNQLVRLQLVNHFTSHYGMLIMVQSISFKQQQEFSFKNQESKQCLVKQIILKYHYLVYKTLVIYIFTKFVNVTMLYLPNLTYLKVATFYFNYTNSLHFGVLC